MTMQSERLAFTGAISRERADTALAPSEPVERLRQRRAELEAQLDALATEEPEAIIHWSNHLAEHAQAHEEWRQLAVVRAILTQELGEIEHALQRAAAGEYGRCVDCQRAIPPRRLEAMLTAVRCVACQEQREARGIAH